MGMGVKHAVIAGSVLGFGLLLVSLGAGLGWGLFPDIVRDAIKQDVVLSEDSEAWNWYVEKNATGRLHVYFFHVANPMEIMRGGRPNVTELGPYVYDLLRTNDEVEADPAKAQVSYDQRMTLHFNAAASGALTEDDTVRTLTAPLMGLILEADRMDNEDELLVINGENAIEQAFPYYTPFPNLNLFAKHTVRDLMTEGMRIYCPINTRPPSAAPWKALCDLIKKKEPKIETIRPVPISKDFLFSYFYHKTSRAAKFTVNTGTRDVASLGHIVSWNGAIKMDYWGETQCDSIRGTDAAIFPPFLTRDTKVDVFMPEFCRSVTTRYLQDTSFSDLRGLRYVVDSDQLSSVATNPDNFCYCAKTSGCLQSGVIDLLPCTNSPVVLTFPHFYQASADYHAMVVGLHPQQDKHQTYFDIEPKTGLALRTVKRYQYNMMLKPVVQVDVASHLPEALLPLLWVEEIMEAERSQVEALQDSSLFSAKQLNDVRWSLIGIGVVAFMVGAGLLFTFWLRN